MRRRWAMRAMAGLAGIVVLGAWNGPASADAQDPRSPIDLVQTSLNAPGKMKAGKKVRVSDELECVGDEPSPLTFTYFYLSKDDTLDAGDILVGGRRVPPLGRGRVHQDITSIEIPATVAPGPYYLIARANATNTAVERYLDNNTRANKVTIQPVDVKK